MPAVHAIRPVARTAPATGLNRALRIAKLVGVLWSIAAWLTVAAAHDLVVDVARRLARGRRRFT